MTSVFFLCFHCEILPRYFSQWSRDSNCNSARLLKMTEEEALFGSQDLDYWGAFARPFSPMGGAFANFSTGQGPGICQPRGYSGAFDMHTVSYQNITTQTKSRLGHLSRTGGLSRHVQGSKLKKSSSTLLTTNCRNIVARCKFLVGSLYNVNDTAH